MILNPCGEYSICRSSFQGSLLENDHQKKLLDLEAPKSDVMIEHIQQNWNCKLRRRLLCGTDIVSFQITIVSSEIAVFVDVGM